MNKQWMDRSKWCIYRRLVALGDQTRRRHHWRRRILARWNQTRHSGWSRHLLMPESWDHLTLMQWISKKMKEKWVRMSTLPLLLWSSSIGSLRLKNEPSSSSSIRTFRSKPWRTWLDEQAMAGWTSKWREEAKPWLDEQASEEQARQGSSTGVLMQQAGEPSDQLAVSARQTNENVAPKRAQAKQTSERKNSTSERNIRAATRHRQKFVRHRVHRHA